MNSTITTELEITGLTANEILAQLFEAANWEMNFQPEYAFANALIADADVYVEVLMNNSETVYIITTPTMIPLYTCNPQVAVNELDALLLEF